MESNRVNTDILFSLINYGNTHPPTDIYHSLCLHILQHFQEIPSLNIYQLSKLCFCSPATISRFCADFGCENFKDFKFQITQSLLVHERELNIPFKEFIHLHQFPNKCIDKIYDLSIQSLEKSKESISMKDVDALCHLLHDYHNVYLIGHHLNGSAAHDFRFKLAKVGKLCTDCANIQDEKIKLDTICKGSMVIYLTVGANNKEVQDLCIKVHNNEAKISIITMNYKSSALSLADHVFLFKGLESDFSESSYSGIISLRVYLDLVYFRYGLLYLER